MIINDNDEEIIMKSLKIILIVFIIASICYSCSDDGDSISRNTTGRIVSTDGCKFTNTEQLFKSNYAPTHQDCINYEYDSTKTLTITHINAAFNCCPTDITADIIFEGNTITITEHEVDAPCDCICLYDVAYQFDGVEEDRYTIVINGMYLGDTSPVMAEFDLTTSYENTFCTERDIYPWITE